MRTLIKYCILLFALAQFGSCTQQEPVSITLSQTVLTLKVQEEVLLTATVSPADISVDWTTSDPSVAIVINGLVIAQAQGNATITAQAAGESATCLVFVEDGGNEKTFDNNLSDAVRQMPASPKRGVGFGDPFFVNDVDMLGSVLSWAYNWGPDLTSTTVEAYKRNNMEFCPMAWNKYYDANRIRAFAKANPSCKYLLAFNEPNLVDQAKMTPKEAAALWPDLKKLADELGLKIVAPAMNYGTLEDYHDPIKWLDEFFAQPQVNKSDVCALSLHCYMDDAGSLKSYIDRFDKYNLPIWMTEFCAWEIVSSAEQQGNYMSEAILMMETDKRVERYAWFLARGKGSVNSKPFNQLLTKNALVDFTSVGKIFMGLSSLDKSTYLDASRHILMNTCSDVSTLANSGVSAPRFQPIDTIYNTLVMQNFTMNKWIEFQVEAKKEMTIMGLSYLAYSKAELAIQLDGKVVTNLPLNRNSEFEIATIPVTLAQGKHTIRITNKQGNVSLHWMQFK